MLHNEVASGRKPQRVGNPGLRAARRQRGWTEEDVACGLHALAVDLDEPEPAVDRIQVAKWELGIRTPGLFYQARLCLLYEAVPDRLGFISRPTLLRAIGDLARKRLEKRRTYGMRGEQVGGSPIHVSGSPVPLPAAFPDLDQERLSAAMTYLWPVDAPLLDGLERAARHLDWRAELELPDIILPDLSAFLAAVQRLLSRPQAAATPRLKTIGARIAHDIAYLDFVQGRQPAAFNHYAVSEALAREAGNDLELATTLVGKNGIYIPGDMDTAVQVTEAAALLLNHQAPSGLAVWVWGERAMQEAELGHEVDARRYLDRALRAAAADPRGLNLFAPDMPPSWLERRPAIVDLKLGRPVEALVILEANRPRIDPRFTKEMALNSIDQASAWAMRGEVQAACEMLVDAINISATTGNWRSVDLARQVRQRQLARWRSDPTVRRLDDALRAATITQ